MTSVITANMIGNLQSFIMTVVTKKLAKGTKHLMPRSLQSDISRPMHLFEFIALYEASSFQKDQFFLAASLTSISPMSKVDRSCVMFFSRSPGRSSTELRCGLKESSWFASSLLATCSNSEKRRKFTAKKSTCCSFMRRTSAFLKKSCHRILRTRRRVVQLETQTRCCYLETSKAKQSNRN